eukprot:TRINITY_DN782_c0_g1_i1.p1 TRINITY_DN782_c0_g1~~TRINITY_DN782_c0_g1_i1.p1  ORF type:complete len:313 (+),score=100.34 TRINITY_DN782_c0_g1_i1:325-1263(+)
MADGTTVNGVDPIFDPMMNGISKEHPDFEQHEKVSALERKIADLEDEKISMIQENKQQKEKIKLMTLEIDGFKKSKEEMAERLEKMQAEIDGSEDDKKALKVIAARASELETEVFRLQHDLQSSMSECEDNRADLEKLTGESEALKQRNREKDSKIDDLEKEKDFAILQMKKSEAETGKRVRLLQEEVKALVSTNEKLEKAKKDVETLKSSLEGKLKQSEEKSKETDRIIKDLNQKNKLMEARLADYAEEKAEMEKTILEMEKELEKEDVMEESADGGRRGFKFQWPVAAAASTVTIGAAVAMICLRNARQK